MDLGVHLPLMQFGEEVLSLRRLQAAVDAARECGFAALSTNDHFVFQTPWLDGPTALASMIERSGQMTLATTVSLPVLRGRFRWAKALAAIDVLADGRLVAALGPGSSERDYDILGVPYEQRWKRFDEALSVLRALLNGEPPPERRRYYPLPPDLELAPGPPARGRHPRVDRELGLASAYNTTPERFSTARTALTRALEERGRPADGFPPALATMWTWVSRDRSEGDRVLADVLAPVLGARPRVPPGPGLRRPPGALCRASRSLRGRRLPPRLPLAARG